MASTSPHETDLEKLWEACDAGNADRIKELFKTSSTLKPENAQDCLQDFVDESGRTEGKAEIELVRALLASGATAEHIHLGWLIHAPLPSVVVLRLLAENGLDFSHEGHLLLGYAVHSRELIDFLLDQGVDINRTDEDRDTDGRPFVTFARRSSDGYRPRSYDRTLSVLNKAAGLGDIDIFDYLVARGADYTKSIALHTATHCPDPAKTKAMITHLVNKYGFDPNGNDNAASLRHLHHNGLDEAGMDTGVPLNFAIRHQNLAAVQGLLQNGADPTLPEYDLVNDAMRVFPAAIEPFLSAGVGANEVLREAVRRDNLHIAKKCLAHDANPEVIQAENASPEMLEVLGK